MGVKLQSALGGSVELNAPSTASNFTMTVPAGNGTVATTDQLMGFRNRIINGDMRVLQRSVPYTATSGSNYGADRFALIISGADGSATVDRGTMVHGGRTKYTCKFTVVTPPTSLTGVNRWEGITQHIEGFNFQDLVGKQLTISFLFRSNVTGKHSVRLGNGDGGYLASFNYPTANTIQYVSITTPAMPDMVNFGNSQADNGNYMRVQIDYYNAGTLVGAETSNWALGAKYTASGAANWTAAAGNYIELTELQVEAGTIATPFEVRPYSVELALCQRYYQTYNAGALSPLAVGVSQPSNQFGVAMYLPVVMRASPAGSTTGSFAIRSGGDFVVTSIGVGGISGSLLILVGAATSLGNGLSVTLMPTGGPGVVNFSAEL